MLSSIALVMRGSVFAQAIGILVLPILTRSFSPEAFGNFQIFQAITGVLLVCATLRYEIAILRAEGPTELGAVIAICVVINLSWVSLLSSGYFIYSSFTGWHFSDNYGFSILYVVLGVVTGGFIQFWGYFLTRESLFTQSSNSKVFQALTNAGTAVGLALLKPLNSGIVIADIVGRTSACVIIFALSLKRLRQTAAWPAWGDIRRAANKFREYPLIAVPGGLVNMMGAMMTPIMIYHSFDPATSGQFGLLERSVTLPISLITISISQVYMSRLASEIRTSKRRASRQYTRLLLVLTLCILPITFFAVVFADAIFELVFGPGWGQAAKFAQFMAPAYCLSLLCGSINMTLIVLGKQKTQIIWEVARFSAMVALWVGGTNSKWSVEYLVIGHSTLLSVFNIAMLILAFRAIRACETEQEFNRTPYEMDNGASK